MLTLNKFLVTYVSQLNPYKKDLNEFYINNYFFFLLQTKKIEWDDHRMSCSLKSSHIIEKLPRHPSLKCPK